MEQDVNLEQAAAQVEAVLQGKLRTPHVKAFFDEPTFTASYVVHDSATTVAAIIDSVLDFDHPSGRTSYESADAIIAYVEAEGLKVEWLLETHAHADHLSAAPISRRSWGGNSSSAPRSSRCRTCSARSSTKVPASPATARSSTVCSSMGTS